MQFGKYKQGWDQKKTIKKQPQKNKQLCAQWMYVHTYADKHKNTGFKVFAEVTVSSRRQRSCPLASSVTGM